MVVIGDVHCMGEIINLHPLSSFDTVQAWCLVKYKVNKIILPSGNVEGAESALEATLEKLATEHGVNQSRRKGIRFIGVADIREAMGKVFVK